MFIGMYASGFPFGGGGRVFPLGIIGLPLERKLLPFTIGFESREHMLSSILSHYAI